MPTEELLSILNQVNPYRNGSSKYEKITLPVLVVVFFMADVDTNI